MPIRIICFFILGTHSYWNWLIVTNFSTKNQERWTDFLYAWSFKAITLKLVKFIIFINSRSVFDILCEIFYFRSFFKAIGNILGPFLHCESPEEAKELLNSLRSDTTISPTIHRTLFKKVFKISLISVGTII